MLIPFTKMALLLNFLNNADFFTVVLWCRTGFSVTSQIHKVLKALISKFYCQGLILLSFKKMESKYHNKYKKILSVIFPLDIFCCAKLFYILSYQLIMCDVPYVFSFHFSTLWLYQKGGIFYYNKLHF